MDKKVMEEIRELPDDVISSIFSNLNIKDLVKTSALSKQWVHGWDLRIDLNFDLQNMFDDIDIVDHDYYSYNNHQIISTTHALFKDFQSKFSSRLDQFMLHYQGPNIRSIRVNFPLCDQHSDIIASLISQGIAKGVQHIELLFSYYNCSSYDLFRRRIKPCKFSFTHLLSHTHSHLKYLHLQNCLLVEPIEFSGLKNLTTLVLHQVDVTQDLFQGLFSKCVHLVDLTLNNCRFEKDSIDIDINIVSQTLCHLKIIYPGKEIVFDIHIFAPNLKSFQYSSFSKTKHNIEIIESPKLSKFSYRATLMPKPFGFSGFRNVKTVVIEAVGESLDKIIPCLFSECLQLEDVTFKDCILAKKLKITSSKLLHLKIINCGFYILYSCPTKLKIDAFNLSTFEYSSRMTISSIKAPSLLKLFWDVTKREKKVRPFDVIASLHELQNLSMIITHSQIVKLPRVFSAFQNLRQLELFVEGTYNPDMDYFWILDIAMVSPHLQKISLTVRNSHMVAIRQQKREHTRFFFHKELKYVELRGCVGNTHVIELARSFLRNVNSLNKITFSSYDRFYTGFGRWIEGSKINCGCFDPNFIREMLRDDVKKCELIIL